MMNTMCGSAYPNATCLINITASFSLEVMFLLIIKETILTVIMIIICRNSLLSGTFGNVF